MDRQMKRQHPGFPMRLAGTAFASLTLVAIAACDGANQGVQIGTGQTADPVVIDFPIAYVRAPVPADDDGEFEQTDLREQITFDVGGNLYYKARAAVGALPVNITEREIGELGAVRDVEMAYDGSAVLFAMRGPFDETLDDEDQPTWNLWEYTFETDELRRLISSDLTTEIGHDIMPKYLPDGRIIFASTRQTRSQAILLDEGKGAFPALDEDRNEFAFNLHIMESDGTGIEQVTFNQSHDLDPAVLDDGRIVYSRWDNNGPQNDQVNLYRINPDGRNLEILYGNESHDTGSNGATIQFTQPRQAEDGRVFSLVRPFTDTEGGGEVIAIDTARYVENTQPLAVDAGALSGPAQEDATFNEVVTAPGQPSPGGRYFSVYPIQDGSTRMLVSFSQCRLLEILPDDDGDPMTPPPEPNIVPCTDERLADVVEPDPDGDPPVVAVAGDFVVAPPLYGIWIYDPRDQTQLPVVPGEEGFMFTEAVSADPRPTPPTVLDNANSFAGDNTLADNGEGVINIRSVYDVDGTAAVDIAAMADPAQTMAAERVARFLRVEKAVSLPDDDVRDIDNTAFGVTGAFGMKEIVGYTMIEPDGSVMTKVPANTALMISITDASGKRVSRRHTNWITVRPGEEFTCNGCHDPDSGMTHGRDGAFDSAYAGAAVAGVEFPNTDPQWFVGDIGDTMAETRASITCANDGCSSIVPSMSPQYRDVWTDPAVRAPDPDIDLLYTDLDTPPPVPTPCLQDWAPNCRAVINYETHIHPLWNLPRIVFVDDDGDPTTPEVPLLDGNGLPVNDNCLNCHTPIDPANALARVPAGQLELQDGLSADEPDHFHAYRELLAQDNLQTVLNGALVDVIQVVGFDEDGNPIEEPIPIDPPASPAGAIASGDFFSRFEDPADLHHNILSPSEIRLIAEWLDVGAQYYNNPFDAPEN